MADTQEPNPYEAIFPELDRATNEGKLTASAAANVKIWLSEDRYAEYAAETANHVKAGKWKELDDAFWTILPFGTGGRRGRMHPIGCNAINDRTIGESAQGLADYIVSLELDGERRCAIAYDTRINSRRFAELCAGVMAHAGFRVFFLDDYRSTPALSFLVRHKKCDCGIMVTASHNPPSDNAVKVYWSTGGQILPPHDKGIIERVMHVNQVRTITFQQALSEGMVEICTKQLDLAFNEQVVAQRFDGSHDLKMVYSPLHGVGASAVMPALHGDGFTDVEVYGPHATPDGNFPNVPGHVSNPENPQVFDGPIARAKEIGAQLVLATDPDCDRMGCATPVTKDLGGAWTTFTGNQIAGLLADFILEQRKRRGTLTKDHYVVKTLVTTELVRRIADSYGVKTIGELHVGFKYIGEAIDQFGPDKFVFGCEESHGYLVGKYARDKDAAVACMLMAELVADLKKQGKTLSEKWDSLAWQHGVHAERLLNVSMTGSQGMAKMQKLMTIFRSSTPTNLGGYAVKRIRDYLNLVERDLGTSVTVPLNAVKGDMVVLHFADEGNFVAIRPSGTEPKVKCYMFAYRAPELLSNLELARSELASRLSNLEVEFKKLAESV